MADAKIARRQKTTAAILGPTVAAMDTPRLYGTSSAHTVSDAVKNETMSSGFVEESSDRQTRHRSGRLSWLALSVPFDQNARATANTATRARVIATPHAMSTASPPLR